MLSRALTLAAATVVIAVGWLAAAPASAQNLEAGKSPSQIFAGACAECHRGSRGLLKSIPPASLPGFLRQHYTTSPEMAGLLSAYLISNGATDTRYGGRTRGGKEATFEPKPGSTEQTDRHGRKLRPAPEPQQAARPDVDGLSPADERGHSRRNAKRNSSAPEGIKPGAQQAPGEAANEPNPRDHKGRQKLSRRGKRELEERKRQEQERAREEAKEPKTETPASERAVTEPPKGDAAKGETSGVEVQKTGESKAGEPKDADKSGEPNATGAKASDSGSGEPTPRDAKTGGTNEPDSGPAESGKTGTSLRADPVPAVTPAPKTADTVKPSQPATPTSPSDSAPSDTASPSQQSVKPSPAATREQKPENPVATQAAPVTAPSSSSQPPVSALAEPPKPPAGPPTPPISQ